MVIEWARLSSSSTEQITASRWFMSARLSMVKCEDEEMSRRAASDEKDGGAKGECDSLAARSCSLFEYVERLKQ
jgi:hypothetical protein